MNTARVDNFVNGFIKVAEPMAITSAIMVYDNPDTPREIKREVLCGIAGGGVAYRVASMLKQAYEEKDSKSSRKIFLKEEGFKALTGGFAAGLTALLAGESLAQLGDKYMDDKDKRVFTQQIGTQGGRAALATMIAVPAMGLAYKTSPTPGDFAVKGIAYAGALAASLNKEKIYDGLLYIVPDVISQKIDKERVADGMLGAVSGATLADMLVPDKFCDYVLNRTNGKR